MRRRAAIVVSGISVITAPKTKSIARHHEYESGCQIEGSIHVQFTDWINEN